MHNRWVEWKVDLHDDFVPEYQSFHKEVQDELLALITLLEQFGPRLGRPRADTLKGSRYPNMKELRLRSRRRCLARGFRIRSEPPGHCSGREINRA